jgi:heavy metal sensor kinase
MFPSIRSFLAFSYAVAVLLIILALGFGIQRVVERQLRENLDADLQARARQIERAILSEPDTELTEQVQSRVPGLGFGGQGGDVTYVRLYAPDALPLLLSAPEPPLPPTPPARLRRLRGAPLATQRARDGSQLRVLTRRVTYEGVTLAYFQVARQLGPVDRLVGQLRNTLLAGAVGAAALAGALAYALAYQALKPFSKIVADTRRIGADDLDRRLPTSYGVGEVSRLAHSFNALLDRLQRAFELQRRFVADASHELRTPLTTIRGNVEVLLLDPDLPPAVRESLRHVSGETARLSRLVTNLLLLARADAGRGEPARRVVDLHALALETVQQARAAAGEVAVRLGREDQATVLGDADQLRQVLLNLLDNAIKYTPAGGEVSVSVYPEGPWAKLEVRDTGVGIAPEDLDRIFDRFYRAERRPHGASGSGLGLSIVSWVVGAHSGRIDVHSAVGQGSVFTVSLPLATPGSSRLSERESARQLS